MTPDNKWRIAAVEYYNTLPYIRAIQSDPLLSSRILLTTADPKGCAAALKNGAADIALLPIGSMCDFEELYLLGPYGIASDGPVHTVCVFSDKPEEEIYTIRESSASRTSNQLLRLINTMYKKKKKNIVPDDFVDADAQLIIGDDAFSAHKKYAYSYDLGSMWLNITGLPFAFATWVSARPIDLQFQQDLMKAFERYTKPDYLTKLAGELRGILDDPERYYQRNIRFRLKPEHIRGIRLFIEKSGWKWNLVDLSTY